MSTEEEKTMAEALEQERKAKEKLVLDTIASYCTNESKFERFVTIGTALKEGKDKLVASSLSGGKTNFSFKIYLEKSPDTALFAKICFPYALWNPDRSVFYDLKRTENEFAIMKMFTNLMGGPEYAPIATPYLCVNVYDDANTKCKLLVTEWANETDEQFCNQFIDGHVDRRVIPKLAVALATLNASPVKDPDYNDNVRPCFRTMYPLWKVIFGQLMDTDSPKDDCVAFFQEFGQEKFDALVDNLEKEYMKKVEISHSDTAVFNVLVEKKPSIEKLQTFGEKGNFVLCDWEMSFCGPTGRDVGIFQGWPIAAALCHAVQGNKTAAFDILDCIHEFWQIWADTMAKEGNKDEEYLIEAYRNAMGWTGMYMNFAYYMLGLDNEYFPLVGVPEGDAVKAKSSMGIVGLKLMEYAFGDVLGPNPTLDEMKRSYKDLIAKHFNMLLTVAARRGGKPSRRASVLRESGKRISDASSVEEAARRMSALNI